MIDLPYASFIRRVGAHFVDWALLEAASWGFQLSAMWVGYQIAAAVKPGLTGLWQVSGRNDVSYRERVALDILYVRRESLALYIGIILKTIPAVLRRSGSY